MASILSRLSSLVPDFRPFRTPAAGRGTARPRPGQGEKMPVQSAYAGGGRVWFLPYADNTSTDDTPDIRAAMRRMLRDPYVKSAWLSQVLSVLSQPIQVHTPKGKKSRPAQDRADFVRHALENAQDGLLGIGTAVLTNLGSDGYSVSEKVWRAESRGRYANKLTLRALKPKDVDEHGRLIGDAHNNVTGVHSTRTNETWPITDFVYARYLHTFDEPCGMAAFRPSYGAYWSRDTVRKLRIIHKEKNLDGLLLGTYEDPADKGSMEAALERARSSTWLTVPAGTRVELLSKSQAAEGDYKSFDESLREETLVGIALAHLHILQGGVSDARGNTKVHKAVADLGPWLLTYIVQYAINRQIVPDLIDYNYGFSDEYPQVTLGGVSNAEILEQLQVLDGAQRAGFKPSKSYYATELTIQEADPSDPDDLLNPPAAGGGMGGPMGGMGGDPFGGGGGGMPPSPPPALPGGGVSAESFAERPPAPVVPPQALAKPKAIAAAPAPAGRVQRVVTFGETGHVETFGWDDWEPRQNYMVSPGGRVLKRETWERMKARTPQAGGATTANGRATPPADRKPQPADRNIQARLARIRGNPAEALKEVEGDVRAAAAELAASPPPAAEVVNLVTAATPGLDPGMQRQIGTRLAEAVSAGTPEGVRSGFRRLAEWAGGLTGRAAVWAVRGLLAVGKGLLGRVAPPGAGGVPGKIARTLPAVLKYVGVIALSAALFAAAVAAPILLPVALSLKLGVAAVTLPAGAAWMAWGMRKVLKPVGREVIGRWTGYTPPDDMKANPLAARKHSEGGTPQAGEEVALAGKDGKRAAELMDRSQKVGREVLARLTERAVGRLLADPDPLDNTVLFTDEELQEIADSLAATTAAADLLGRSRVRRLAHHAEERAEKFAEGADPDPFDVFADAPDALPPADAVSYFRKLVPSLQLSPERYAPLLGRQAFTLAVAADQSLLDRVKAIILDQLEAGRRPYAVADIQDELDAAGVTPRNPSYASTVYRTNMNDAYMQGFSAEMADPAIQQVFPAWEYHSVIDGRERERHGARNGLLYPSSTSFAEVRGTTAGDVCNCRCSGSPRHRSEVQRRIAAGERIQAN